MKTIITIIVALIAPFAFSQTTDDLYFMLNTSELNSREVSIAMSSRYPEVKKSTVDGDIHYTVKGGVYIVSQSSETDNFIISFAHSNFEAQVELQNIMYNSNEFELISEKTTSEGYVIYVFESDWSFVSFAYDIANGTYLIICSRV